jgi:hypothetical protein
MYVDCHVTKSKVQAGAVTDINPRATRDLQYIGPSGSNSHSQTFVKVLQKTATQGYIQRNQILRPKMEFIKLSTPT